MATSDKYDRQLRLWGKRGQKALCDSSILLVNATAAGTETLKNLVLPGVGKFTVLDNQIVSESDVGNNFFVSHDKIGTPRAEVVKDLLCELNPDVIGEAYTTTMQDMLGSNPNFFTTFTLIAVANVPEEPLMLLSTLCWENNIPLIIVHSYGFLASCRLQYRNHEIIESKPDGRRYDLRLIEPFPALISFCESFDLTALNEYEHAHVPYIVILYHALKAWKENHGGKIPENFSEKNSFKDSIKAMSKNYDMEMNFQEACENSYLLFSSHHADDDLRQLIETVDSEAQTKSFKNLSTFEVLVCGLKVFIDSKGGDLPLSGDVPDMTADSETFIKLQDCYKTKAKEDMCELDDIIKKKVVEDGITCIEITEEELDTFCKNVRNIHRVGTRSVVEERTPTPSSSSPVVEDIVDAINDPYYDNVEQTPMLFYLSLRGAWKFEAREHRYPGDTEGSLEADATAVWSDILSVAETYAPKDSPEAETLISMLSKKHASEIVRCGSAELHNIAALVGGIASQEAVKLITHQYVPLNNTYIYNGIAGVGSSFRV